MHSMVSFRVDQLSLSCWRFITELAGLYIRACSRTLCIWISKRLSSVSHQRLLLKLSRYGSGVSGKLLQWFESCLGGLAQQCLVHGFTQVVLQFHQKSLRAVSSVLLPVIQNRIALFADDSKGSSVIENLQD